MKYEIQFTVSTTRFGTGVHHIPRFVWRASHWITYIEADLFQLPT